MTDPRDMTTRELVNRAREIMEPLDHDDFIVLRELVSRFEELEGALRKLAKDPPATLDEPDLDWEVIQKMRATARIALQPKAGS